MAVKELLNDTTLTHLFFRRTVLLNSIKQFSALTTLKLALMDQSSARRKKLVAVR
jgi:hypothetical protein